MLPPSSCDNPLTHTVPTNTVPTNTLPTNTVPPLPAGSATSPSIELPTVDREQLHESLAAVGTDLRESLALLRETYLEDAQALVSQVVEFSRAPDFEQLRFCSHTLKSSSALMGAMQLSETCREIECKARQQNPDGLADLAAQAVVQQRAVAEVLLAYDPVAQASAAG